jgi:hypothetical protein
MATLGVSVPKDDRQLSWHWFEDGRLAKVHTVDFHGDQLLGIENGKILIPVKPICDGMGLPWEAQRQRINRHPILAKGACIIQVPFGSGGAQEMVCLPLSRINFWLATVSPDRIINPDVRIRVLLYQEECAEALFFHFQPAASASESSTTAAPEPPVDLARRDDVIRGREASERSEQAANQAHHSAVRTEKAVNQIREGKKKYPLPATTREAMHILWTYYRSLDEKVALCPCCFKSVIMESRGHLKRGSFNWDHTGPGHKRSLYDGWYVCVECNIKFEETKNDTLGYRQEKKQEWDEYLGNVRKYYKLNKAQLGLTV